MTCLLQPFDLTLEHGQRRLQRVGQRRRFGPRLLHTLLGALEQGVQLRDDAVDLRREAPLEPASVSAPDGSETLLERAEWGQAATQRDRPGPEEEERGAPEAQRPEAVSRQVVGIDAREPRHGHDCKGFARPGRPPRARQRGPAIPLGPFENPQLTGSHRGWQRRGRPSLQRRGAVAPDDGPGQPRERGIAGPPARRHHTLRIETQGPGEVLQLEIERCTVAREVLAPQQLGGERAGPGEGPDDRDERAPDQTRPQRETARPIRAAHSTASRR